MIKAVIIYKNGGGSSGTDTGVMTQTGIRLGSGTGLTLHAVYRPDAAIAKRVLEFFTANIREPNTRKAYARTAGDFATWCLACVTAPSSRFSSRPSTVSARR